MSSVRGRLSAPFRVCLDSTGESTSGEKSPGCACCWTRRMCGEKTWFGFIQPLAYRHSRNGFLKTLLAGSSIGGAPDFDSGGCWFKSNPVCQFIMFCPLSSKGRAPVLWSGGSAFDSSQWAPVLSRWSSDLGRLPFKEKIAGLNPARDASFKSP